MSLVVDASVALKWVLPEAGSDRARGLLANTVLAAPDLLFVECANVLLMKSRRGQISMADAEAAHAAIVAAPIRIIPSPALTADALRIGGALTQTAYDCLYLAAAMAERLTLVTADEAFFRAAAHPLYAPCVQLL